jgi:hypothetical protein
MTELTTTVVGVTATSLIGFLSLLITLVFLWKVYKRGGRHDLTAAARALRDARRPPAPRARRRTATSIRPAATPIDPGQQGCRRDSSRC